MVPSRVVLVPPLQGPGPLHLGSRRSMRVPSSMRTSACDEAAWYQWRWLTVTMVRAMPAWFGMAMAVDT